MQGAGSALMGIGTGTGTDRAIKAAEDAINSPLLETSIDGARGVLISLQGSSAVGLHEIYQAADMVQKAVHPEANIIFGTVIDESLGDQVKVTVIAAGFDEKPAAETAQHNVPRRELRQERMAAETGAIVNSTGPIVTPGANDTGGFGETVANPPLESQIKDPAFDIDDEDELDIPDFLK